MKKSQQEEDEKLISYIKAHGEGCWRSLPKAAGLLRCGKSCRLRWKNYLRPDLRRGNFTAAGDELIIELHGLLGNKWSLIAGQDRQRDQELLEYNHQEEAPQPRPRPSDSPTHRADHSPLRYLKTTRRVHGSGLHDSSEGLKLLQRRRQQQ
ncbi:hypothetical protein OPV22_020194 [Ensete ventricosum]|uniref:HTH myb-type domain-containing protein n=1 Tax=Ensete ventricosum TaxID=4639 RepID=A0AAV8QMQ5_ENSVE|nr:hypothetical protein OPV22_020194 [Ensete ventricosum]